MHQGEPDSRIPLWALLPIFLFPSTSMAQINRAEPIIEGSAALAADYYLQRTVPLGFSGAVVVRQSGSVLVKGFGVADDSTLRPIDTETGFQLASVSKVFTAAAILQLDGDGKLDIDSSIGTWLPNVPSDKAAITVRHLLAHRSGIPADAGGRTDLATGLPRSEFERRVLTAPLEFSPGAEVSYSNAGFGLLAAIVERVSGVPFPKFLRSTFFDPLGMTRTGHVSEPRFWTDSSLAINYRGTTSHGTGVHPGQKLDWNEVGSIGMISSAADMNRWESALATGRIFPWKPMALLDHEDWNLGWYVRSTTSGVLRPNVIHTGHQMPEGMNAVHIRYLDTPTTIIVLSNRGESSYSELVTSKLQTLLFGGELTIPAQHFAGADTESLSGTYESAEGSELIISKTGQRVTAVIHGQSIVESLLAIDTSTHQLLNAANTSTASIMESVLTGDMIGVAESLPERRTPAEWGTWFADAFREVYSRYGAYRSSRVLHSAPNGDGTATMVEVQLQRGTALVGFFWSSKGEFLGTSGAGSLASGSAAPQPGSFTLTTVSENLLMLQDLESGLMSDLRMMRADDGKVTALLLGQERLTRRDR